MNTRLKWVLLMLMTLSVFSLSSVAFSQHPTHPSSFPAVAEKDANKPGNYPDNAALVSGTEALTMPMQATRLRQEKQQTRMDSRTALQQPHLHQNEQFPNPFSSDPRLATQENPGDIPLAGVEMVSSIGGGCYGLAVQDNIAYLGEGTTVIILDISNAANPVKLANISLPDIVWDIEIAGSLLFVANDQMGGVQIVDVNTPTEPIILGSYDTPGLTWSVEVVNNRLYVADPSSGMHILDISNPSTPTLLGSYTAAVGVTGVQVDNTIAYLSDYSNGLLVLDVSNPAAPTLIGSYATPQRSWTLQLSDNKVYMTHYVADPPTDPDEPTPSPNDELHIIDVSNPTAPTLAGIYPGLDTPNHLFVVAGYVYVADDKSGLKIIDARNPANPSLASNYVASGDMEAVVVQSGLAYLASDTAGLLIVDVSQPTTPVFLGKHNVIGIVSDISVANGNTYIAARENGLQVIDEHNNQVGAFPLHSDINIVNSVQDIAVSGTTVYITIQSYNDKNPASSSNAILHIYDISTPTRPQLLGNYTVEQYAISEVEVAGTLVYFLVNEELHILDVSNPSEPQLLHIFPAIWGMYVDQTTLYLPSENGLSVLDMSNPVSPIMIGETTDISGDAISVQDGKAYLGYRHYLVVVDVDPNSTNFMDIIGWYERPEGELTYDVASANNLAYSVSSDETDKTFLSVFDISNPSQPMLLATYTPNDWNSYTVHIAISGDYVYVATGLNRMDILNVSNPSNPQLVASHETSEFPLYSRIYWMAIVGNRAFLAAGRKGFEILDISNPTSPIYIGGKTNTGLTSASRVMVIGERAYLKGDNLVIIDVQQPTAPRLLANYSPYVADMFVQEDVLYTVEAEGGLHILDISIPTHPKTIGQYDTSGESYGVTVQDSIAYVADGSVGLLMLDVTNPADIKLLGRYVYDEATMGLAASVQVSGTIAYVADTQRDDGPTGLRMIDVANPTTPELLGYYATSSSVLNILLEGDKAFVSTQRHGILVLNIYDPANPELREQIKMPRTTTNMQKIDNILHIANTDAGYQTYRYIPSEPYSEQNITFLPYILR